MLYPQYFIDDLKARADLVRIIQPYAQDLKKKGANWMACCPFHQEKTPSFSVNPAKGFYKCFGCGKGGTAFNFVMEMEGLNFPEAVKRVAEISGVMLPEPVDDVSYERSKKKREEKKQLADQIIELNQIALDFWEAELQAKNAKAKAAREYLEQRGISDEVQKAFHIGFSPDSWDALLNLLKEKGADEKLIEQSGLVSVNEEKERVFDKFRGRIMFPVLDVNGKPVAFGARAMGDDQPKYLNSPETAAYVKGQHLYGLFQSKDEIRKKRFAILVEGYLDLIALYQFGVTNVAASLGTAFTVDQAKLLKRNTTQVVMSYDPDEAGAKAAKRILSTLLFEEFQLKILSLPENLDPDDYVRKYGALEFERLRGKALSVFDFLLSRIPKEYNLSNNQRRLAFIEEVIPICASFRSHNFGMGQRQFFDSLMSVMQIFDVEAKRGWWNEVKRQSELRRKSVGSTETASRISESEKTRFRVKPLFAEIQLLALLIEDEDIRSEIIPALEETDYSDLASAPLFSEIVSWSNSQSTNLFEYLMSIVNEDYVMGQVLETVTLSRIRDAEHSSERKVGDAHKCLITLRDISIANRIMEISRQASLAEQAGDHELFNQLTFEQLELEKIRRDLQRRIVQM